MDDFFRDYFDWAALVFGFLCLGGSEIYQYWRRSKDKWSGVEVLESSGKKTSKWAWGVLSLLGVGAVVLVAYLAYGMRTWGDYGSLGAAMALLSVVSGLGVALFFVFFLVLGKYTVAPGSSIPFSLGLLFVGIGALASYLRETTTLYYCTIPLLLVSGSILYRNYQTNLQASQA